MNYTTLCSLKPRLRMTDDDTWADDALRSLIASVSGWIDQYCGRTFGPREYTHFLKGSGTQRLALPERPVQSVTAVYYDEKGYWGDAPGAFGADKLLVEGVDYALERDQSDGSSQSGVIYRINGVWPSPFGRVAPYGAGAGVPTLANVPSPVPGT